MKKNININLFGTLYAIDEDACNLLENYLDNMKSYFAKREGGDEIVDDIEHRVAEHLWSLKEQGRDAVDIDTVKQIISSIGNPAEVDGYSAAADKPLGSISWAESRRIPALSVQNDSTEWTAGVMSKSAGWHYLASAPFRHDGGTIEYRLRIGQHDVADGNAMGDISVAHVGIAKK